METLHVSGVTLRGFAQGGKRTSIFVPEVQAVFDTGCFLKDIPMERVFITHGHPDHIGALPAIVAKRSLSKVNTDMQIHAPKAIASTIEAVLLQMAGLYGDRPENRRFQVHGIEPGETVPLNKRIVVRGLATTHRTHSIGWAVEQTTAKLKPEFTLFDGHEIARIKRQGTEVTVNQTETLLCVPGDTKIEFLLEQEQARKAKVLVHEVTVWDEDDRGLEKCREYGHTHIAEMVEHCEKFEGEALVLCHRSMRWSREHIEAMARRRFPASMLPKIHFFDGGNRQ